MLAILIKAHAGLATTVVVFNTVLGLWGVISFLRGGQRLKGNYAGALALSPILGLVQMLIGLVFIGNGLGGAARLVHYLYGVLVVINVPATFALTRGRDDRGMLLTYGAVLLFTAGCGIRAWMVASGR